MKNGRVFSHESLSIHIDMLIQMLSNISPKYYTSGICKHKLRRGVTRILRHFLIRHFEKGHPGYDLIF